MHEIAGNQESLAAGDEQGHADVDGPMAKRNIRSPNGNERAEEQRIKDKEIPPDMMTEMVGWMLLAHNFTVNIGPGTGKSKPDRRSARTDLRLRCGW